MGQRVNSHFVKLIPVAYCARLEIFWIFLTWIWRNDLNTGVWSQLNRYLRRYDKQFRPKMFSISKYLIIFLFIFVYILLFVYVSHISFRKTDLFIKALPDKAARFFAKSYNILSLNWAMIISHISRNQAKSPTFDFPAFRKFQTNVLSFASLMFQNNRG